MRVPNDITHSHVLKYIRGIVSCNGVISPDDIVWRIKKRCEEEEVPIIEPEVESLLEFLLMTRRPSRILEIGTAYGFSSIFMSHFLAPGGKILTIERNEVMWKEAEVHIQEAGLTDVIDLRKGQAADVLGALKEPYDFILLDASVGQYSWFYEEAKRLLKPGGILLADNVLHGGMVAHERLEIPRRQRTIHARMREFLEAVLQDTDMVTSIQPIGDGVLLAYKRVDNEGEL